jgi:hypothetical protein
MPATYLGLRVGSLNLGTGQDVDIPRFRMRQADVRYYRSVALLRACSIHRLNVDASSGFARTQIAPAADARSRIPSCGNAVMKMIGICEPAARKRVCSSSPPMRGICTSETKHDVSCN